VVEQAPAPTGSSRARDSDPSFNVHTKTCPIPSPSLLPGHEREQKRATDFQAEGCTVRTGMVCLSLTSYCSGPPSTARVCKPGRAPPQADAKGHSLPRTAKVYPSTSMPCWGFIKPTIIFVLTYLSLASVVAGDPLGRTRSMPGSKWSLGNMCEAIFPQMCFILFYCFVFTINHF
jgi:hypothetical protein